MKTNIKINSILIKLSFYLFFIYLISSSQILAQGKVDIRLKKPPPYSFHTENLWKVTLNNPGPEVNVYLYGTIEKQGQKLVDGVTSSFLLKTGIKNVNANEISPIDIEKYTNEVDNTITSTGTLPSGVYNICVYVKDALSNNILGSYCNDYQIINASISELVSPPDGDYVKQILPVFNWLPPTPIPTGRKLTYEFRLTEVLDKQSAYFAMQSNPLLYSKKNLLATQIQYPLSASKLVSGKSYAWQVITFIDDNMFSESEVWQFKYTPANSNIVNIEKEYRIGFDSSRLIRNRPPSDNIEFTAEPTSSGLDNNSESIKPLKFTGSYKVDGSHNSRQGNGSEMPRNLGSIKFDPSLYIYGVPFNLNVYIDNRQEDDKQNINSVDFEFRPDVLTGMIRERIESNEKVSGFMKALSYFNTLGIGETYPNYSQNTLNGTRVRGLDFEFNPGIFYLAISGLRNLDPIPDKTFTRNLYAGRIGLGSKDESHFHFTILKASDEVNSIDINNVPVGTAPQDNVLLGTEGKLSLLDNALSFEGEAVGSMLTRDKSAPDLVSEDFPSFLQNLLSPKVSSQFDYMFRFGSKYVIEKSGTTLDAGFKYYGPGYVSLGAPNIKNGYSKLSFKIGQSFENRKIKLGFNIDREQNNTGNLNRFTETTLNMGFDASFFFDDLPYVIVSYYPYSKSNDATIDSLKVNSTSNNFNFISGITSSTKKYINSINLLVSSMGVSSLSGEGDYNLLNFNLSDNISFVKIPVSINGSLGFIFTNSDSNSTQFTGDLGGTYTLNDIWSNTIGVNYFGEKNLNRLIGLYYNSVLNFMDVIDFTFDANFNIYREEIYEYGNYEEFLFRAGLSKSW